MPDLPTGDANSFGTGGPNVGPHDAPDHVPELSGRPDFAPRAGGGFMNPKVGPQFAGKPFVLDDLGYDGGVDGTQGQFFMFNDYKLDKTPVRQEWRVVAGSPPRTREVPLGDGTCQPQSKVTEELEEGRWRVVLQRWEVRETSLSLERWNDLASGGPIKGALGLLGASGATAAGGGTASVGGIAAGGAAGIAGGVAAVGAAGAGGLVFGDMIGREAGWVPESTKVIESGWIPVARYWDGDGGTGQTRVEWEDDGLPVACSGEAVGTNPDPAWKWPAVVVLTVMFLTGAFWFFFNADDDGDDNPDSMSEEEFEAIDASGPDPTPATDDEPLPGLDDDEEAGEGEEEEASTPGPTVPQSNGPTTVKTFDYRQGSHIFTMTVDGDGEAFAADEDVQWYSWRFRVSTPDGDFVVDSKFSNRRNGREFTADVWSGDNVGMGDLIPDAVVTAEWTASDTLVIVADQVGVDAAADSATLELVARVVDDDGQRDYEDTVTWER